MKKLTVIKFTLLAIFAGLFLTASAQAATYTVDRTDDATVSNCTTAPADCTLRGAIAAANAAATNDVIEFDAAVFSTQQTITLNGTQLSIANNGTLTINGTGANQLTVSGNNASRVFLINSGANITINDITVTGANTPASDINGWGGGFFSFGTLTLNNLIIDNNSARFGGGFWQQSGTTNVNNTTISNNTAVATGSGSGIYKNSGTMSLIGTTIRNNPGNSVYTRSTSVINNSTISNNGDGIFNDGGGNLTVNSSTISNNNNGVVNNSGTTTLNNSIIANGNNLCGRNSGTINASYSLIQGGLGCVNGTNTNNLTGNPNLGPLANNGGSTFTHALLAGSIAIDAGNSTLTTDQRGSTRPVDDPNSANGSGNLADIGSFEVLDSDGDGVEEANDNCPMTFNPDQANFDGDEFGDACDDDDDNDGVLDVNDAFPFDPNESVDTDGDGIGNNADTDDDNDDQSDVDEMACGSDPLDAASKSPDNDGDNVPDCVDTDDDNDGVLDTEDNCQFTFNPDQADFDEDGIGDTCDPITGPPIRKEQCKDGGFMRFDNPTFRNQGQCVSFVESRRP